jgi:hypothetical protein
MSFLVVYNHLVTQCYCLVLNKILNDSCDISCVNLAKTLTFVFHTYLLFTVVSKVAERLLLRAIR